MDRIFYVFSYTLTDCFGYAASCFSLFRDFVSSLFSLLTGFRGKHLIFIFFANVNSVEYTAG